MELTKTILNVLAMKNYMPETHLPKAVSQNYLYVRQALNELLNTNQIAEVGDSYDSGSGKLVKYYTAHVEKAVKITATIQKRQYTSQRNALLAALAGRYLESCNIQPIKDELELIKQGRHAVPHYHQLSVADMVEIYGQFISNAKNAQGMTRKNGKVSSRSAAELFTVE